MAKKAAADNTIARVTEVISTSDKSFEDAVGNGIKRASKSLRGIRGAWVKEMKVDVVNGKVTNYRVDMLVTFVVEE
ncbi:MAG: dodecin domain-containing protein [Moraxellaceae bacterium]|jgi:flavin-binding protein dodecin|nr:dodecin domain-containing protein [Moraxellaceae bacterium]MCC6200114.1 dodecin domain-containing protein [Moraxellaceae bacterium]HQV41921.1 dodecin family protein [Moraxellaceae bacterium]HQX89348.1 dodecin family protein [Moraxellaceae bacterium]